MTAHNQSMLVATTFSLAFGSFWLTPPANALKLEPITTVPSDWTSVGWKLEGRAGGFGGADYEFAIGPDGAQADNTGQVYWDWENDVEVDWVLNWDGTTALFSVENLDPISYSVFPNSDAVLEGFSLLTVAKTETDFVEPGTEIEVVVNQVNGIAVDQIYRKSVAPSNGTDLNRLAWTSDTLISSLTGTVRMSWNTVNPNQAQARSRLGFQIVGFDLDSTDEISIPEPSSVFGFLALGTFAFGRLLMKNKAAS